MKEVLPQVLHNCLISDAEYWGYYSTCGLLLRLREQYRFEKGIPPGATVDRQDIGQWIERRESDWQRLEHEPLRDITINGRGFSPFDTPGINAALAPQGLLYGGGHGVYMKPVFFLAELKNSSQLGPYTVLTAGREYARDLSIHPAMSRGPVIMARSDMAHAMIRDRFEEFQTLKRQNNLSRAFEAYGATVEADDDMVRQVATSELETFIHHEAGELMESERMGPDWTGMMEALGQSRTGLLMRGVKDALADTAGGSSNTAGGSLNTAGDSSNTGITAMGGTLSHIISTRKTGSLYFLVASLTGLRYTLLADVRQTVTEFASSCDWQAIDHARVRSYNRARDLMDKALEAYRTTPAEELDAAIAALCSCSAIR